MTIAIIQTILPVSLEEDTYEAGDQYILNEKLKRSLHECELICAHAGIKTGKISVIRVNPLLRSSWERCITDRIAGTHTIEINEVLLDNSVPDLSLKRTIIHELCHTVKDGHGHKKGWLVAAERLKKVDEQYLLVFVTENRNIIFLLQKKFCSGKGRPRIYRSLMNVGMPQDYEIPIALFKIRKKIFQSRQLYLRKGFIILAGMI